MSSITLVRRKAHETFTIQGTVTDTRTSDDGSLGAARINGHRTEDGSLVSNVWYAVGPDALDGSLVSYQRVTIDGRLVNEINKEA